jgi:hypothetical protein
MDEKIGEKTMNAKDWYSSPIVAWNICKACWNREVSITAKSNKDGREFHKKSITMTNIQYAKATLANPRETIIDVFTSLTEYDHTPILATKWTERKKFFSKTKPKKWIIAFDFDSRENIAHAAIDCYHTLEWLAQTRPDTRYSIKYSGGKGFHIETDWKPAYQNGLKTNRTIAETLKLSKELETLDTAIYTPRREWRAPWTIHHSGRIAYPMTLTEFADFLEQLPDSQRWMTPKRIYQNRPIKNMGFKWQNPQTKSFQEGMNEIKKVIKC